MAKNKIQDLQNHLFEMIEKLNDEDGDKHIASAKAIVEVSNAIVSTAKLQLSYIDAVDKMNGTPTAINFFNNGDAKQIEEKK